MDRMDDLLSHVWVVRTFIKHSEEAEEEEGLLEVQRVLYDYMLALGPALKARDSSKLPQASGQEVSSLARSSCSVPSVTARDFHAHQFSDGPPVAGSRRWRSGSDGRGLLACPAVEMGLWTSGVGLRSFFSNPHSTPGHSVLAVKVCIVGLFCPGLHNATIGFCP